MVNPGKYVCAIVARTNSTRLPKKVLRPVGNAKLIEQIVARMKSVKAFDSIYIATSTHEDDAVLCDIAAQQGIESYRGSELSVIDRLLDIADIEQANYVVRVTGDNVFTDPRLLELLIAEIESASAATGMVYDYARVEGAPIGATAEIMRVEAVKDCLKNIEPKLSEYLMLYMFDPSRYRCVVLNVDSWCPPATSLTVDTDADMERTLFVQAELSNLPHFSLKDIIDLDKKKAIPHFYLDTDAEIRLPENKTCNLSEFLEMMKERANSSAFARDLTLKEYLDE